MGSKRNNHSSNSYYSNNNSNTRQSPTTNGNNSSSKANSTSNSNNATYQANGNANSSSHSLKHNSTKDKINKRSNKKVLSIVFDSLNSGSNNNDNVTKMNLSSFNTSVLRKYKDTYKIKTKMNSTREDLLNAVTKHWNSQELSEKDIITQFIYTVRNHDNLLKLPLNAYIKTQLPKSSKVSNNNNNN